MTNPFEQMVAFSDQNNNKRNHIGRPQFEKWRQEFSFNALHGLRYGQSFCNHFNITDNILFYALTDPAQADTYIEKHYLARS